jgi:4,5-dihydroxyphthalate decarboxylase
LHVLRRLLFRRLGGAGPRLGELALKSADAVSQGGQFVGRAPVGLRRAPSLAGGPPRRATLAAARFAHAGEEAAPIAAMLLREVDKVKALNLIAAGICSSDAGTAEAPFRSLTMADIIPLALTCADYARIMPLATGEVKPEGIALTMILGSRGSWPARAEMLRRAVQDPAVQGGEWSMAQYLYRIDQGDRRYVGLPVFPLRNFTARDLYIRRGGPIRKPADLAGQRIGMYSYTASGSIWYRHFLRFVGLDPATIEWWIGDIDTPWSAPMDHTLPSGVRAPLPGRSLSDMLMAGELEAIYSPPRPKAYHPQKGPLARLFPDFRQVEQEYFRKTGAFPPQHLIVIRRQTWEANPWIARSLTEAFIAANDCFTAAQKGFPYATPWLEAELEDTLAVMGDDFHPYGLEPNRVQIDAFAGEAFRLGLTTRLVTTEEYFADYLQSC